MLIVEKKDTQRNKLSFHSVEWLRYTKTFERVQYTNSLAEEKPFCTIDLERSAEMQTNFLNEPKILYNGPVSISKKKKTFDGLERFPETRNQIILFCFSF